jgi:hypothetical protein
MSTFARERQKGRGEGKKRDHLPPTVSRPLGMQSNMSLHQSPLLEVMF